MNRNHNLCYLFLADFCAEYINTFILVVDALKSMLKNMAENLLVCILQDMESQNPIKADLRAKVDLVDDKNEQIFSGGSYFEVKMMDVNTDSYLSELFSIFKTSKNIEQKSKYESTYDYVISYIYDLFIY